MQVVVWTLRLKAIGSSFNYVAKLSADALGSELFALVAKESGFAPNSFKLMCSGRYIKATETLEANKLKDGASILVMKQANSESAQPAADVPVSNLAAEKKEEEERVERVLQAAEEMVKREDDGDGSKYYFELTNQNGEPIAISGTDRQAILLGLALHEKGRKWLAKDKFDTALEYFLAADKAFNRCTPRLIEAIDNPGFLSLDIAWCYFMLQKIELLKDAAWRLARASQFFDQSYGPLQERLITLKGGACPEMVVYVRLYLLEAIVSFHGGNRERAAQFIIQCEQKLQDMSLDPNDVTTLEGLGFTTRESRISLRAANKNVTAAVEYAMSSRESLKQRRDAERRQRQERSAQHRYGRCADGTWVNIQLLERMSEMGFEKLLVAEALRQANNVEHVALGLLTDHAHLLRDVASNSYKPPETLVDEVVGFGFEREEARKAVRLMMGDTERAVNYLLFKSGVDVEGADEFAQIEAQIEAEQDEVGGLSDNEANEEEAEVAGPAPMDDPLMPEDPEYQRQEELRKAEMDLIEDIGDDPDAHLDFTLDAEAKFLTQYKSMLFS